MNTDASTDTAARLAFVVGRFNRRLRSATGGLSHGLLSALASVTKHGPIRLAELAQVESVSAPSITRMIAELETRGLVARKPDPGDGRAVLIEVTTDGAHAVLQARAARADVASGMLDELDDDEVASIMSAMPALERMIGEG